MKQKEWDDIKERFIRLGRSLKKYLNDFLKCLRDVIKCPINYSCKLLNCCFDNLLAMIIFIILILMYYAMHLYMEPCIREQIEQFDFLDRESNNLYMLNAIFYSIATLLLTGVTLVAPIQSLSLHQFQDSLFNMLVHASQKENKEKYNRRTQYYKRELCYLQDMYNIANKFFFPIWFSALVLLVCEIFVIISYWKLPQILFVEGIFFIIMSLTICAGFGILSYSLFTTVRPGERKLYLYLSHFADNEAHLRDCQVNMTEIENRLNGRPSYPKGVGVRWFLFLTIVAVFGFILLRFINSFYKPVPPSLKANRVLVQIDGTRQRLHVVSEKLKTQNLWNQVDTISYIIQQFDKTNAELDSISNILDQVNQTKKK